MQAVKNMSSIEKDAYNEDLFSFVENKTTEIED
jgi:hypothetical protein